MKRFERMVGFGRVAAAVAGVSCLIFLAAFVSCGSKNTGGGGDVKPQESVTNDSGKVTGGEVKPPESVTDDGGSSVKLLKSITDGNGKALKKFEYDGQNRLVKVYSGDDITTITYADNLVTVNDKKYVINGNTIKVESDYPMTLGIDKDGYIAGKEKEEWTSNVLYEYQDGNLASEIMDECSPSFEPYDDKKSPFSNSKTPKWLIQELFDIVDASKNNVIKSRTCEGVDAYITFVNEYEYDGDGFPVKRKQTMNGETDMGTERFTYFVKGKAEPSAKTSSEADANSFTDGRNGKTYKTVVIGGKRWMAENLNYKTDGSWCYGESGQVYDSERGEHVTISNSEIQSNCAKYGRLYNWSAAKTVCPAGWHLPSREEWGKIAEAAGGTGKYGTGGKAGKKLKAKSGWRSYTYTSATDGREQTIKGTDDYYFSALPGGRRFYDDGNFGNAGYSGYWWTVTEDGSGDAYYRGMGYSSDYSDEGNNGKGYGYSVRCAGGD